jgi:hypothetical protein
MTAEEYVFQTHIRNEIRAALTKDACINRDGK